MNTVNLIGNICNELVLKRTNSGKSVMECTIAVNRPYAKDTTDFIPLVIWGATAEFLNNYGKKGSKIAVSGKLTTRKWQDKDGNNRTAYEVVCDTVELIGGKNDSQQTNTASPTKNEPVFATDETDDFLEIGANDVLPF